jgi:hypothetical protein
MRIVIQAQFITILRRATFKWDFARRTERSTELRGRPILPSQEQIHKVAVGVLILELKPYTTEELLHDQN